MGLAVSTVVGVATTDALAELEVAVENVAVDGVVDVDEQPVAAKKRRSAMARRVMVRVSTTQLLR